MTASVYVTGSAHTIYGAMCHCSRGAIRLGCGRPRAPAWWITARAAGPFSCLRALAARAVCVALKLHMDF